MRIVDAHMHIWKRVPAWRGYQTPQPAYGKALLDGREHAMLPPCFVDSTSPPELALAFMDRRGVESAVLVQEAMDGFLDDTVAEAVQACPGRFRGVALPDPRDPESSAKLEKWFDSGLMGGMKIPFGSFRKLVPQFDLLGHPSSEWLAICDSMSRFVIIHPPSPVEFAPAMRKAAGACEGSRFVIAHMGMPNEPGWEEVLRLCEMPNVFMDLSAVPLLMREDYPCHKSRNLIKETIRKIGAKKLLWGSDYPRTLTGMTYGQLIDWVADSDSIEEEDKERIMGLNALEVFC